MNKIRTISETYTIDINTYRPRGSDRKCSIDMAGVYIHIPYCRQACHYCNFHFSVSRRNLQDFLNALKAEIAMTADFFDKPLKTVYIGGGTPSLLSGGEINAIFEAICRHFSLDDACEVTIEANPDDLSREKLMILQQTPVNRLSIGIQSFHAKDLSYLNRIHSTDQAIDSLKNAQSAGFENITADLIYGIPTLDDDMWIDNLQRLVNMNISHISAYALTVEEKTALAHFIRRGKYQAVSEEQSARQFEIMMEFLESKGYLHYEISNFSLPGHMSLHNLLYWSAMPYLGLGPSAHSYKDGQRFWNISNTERYISSIGQGILPREGEVLSDTDKYNEYIMTSLRTMWGCDLQKVTANWGQERTQFLLREASKYISRGHVYHIDDRLIVSPAGRFLADGIASGLFIV